MRRRDFLLVPASCFVPVLVPGQGSTPPVEVPFRQVLLRDANLERYATREFTDGLKSQHVQGIQVFARGPGKDLGSLLELCGRRGVSVSYRYGLGRDAEVWESHPEWRLLSSAGANQLLCLNSQYLQYTVSRNAEVLRQHPTLAGVVFEDFDFAPGGCSCRVCAAERADLGLSGDQHNRQVAQRAMERLRSIAGSRTITFRGELDERLVARLASHLEAPASELRFLRTLGKDVVARTNAESAVRLAATGAKVCVEVDNLDPPRLPGNVFPKLQALEPWLRDAKPVTDIGVWKGNEENCVRVLRALHHQFDVVDGYSDLSSYRMLMVSDRVQRQTDSLKAYINRGGAVLVAGPGFDAPLTAAARETIAEQLFQVLPKPAIQARNVPDSAEISMFEQRLSSGVRRVVHVTQNPSTGEGPLQEVQLWVRLPQHPLAVVTVPDLKPVEFVHNEFYTTFTIPRIDGHQAIAFE